MSDYRCYLLTPLGAVRAPAIVITCAEEETAIDRACQRFPVGSFELRKGARRVYVSRAEAPPHPLSDLATTS